MCGIVGYIGPRQASDVLLGGLSRLEYRGYDSAGVAILEDSDLTVVRRIGKLVNLRNAIETVAGTRIDRHRSHAVGDARQAERGERTSSRRLHRAHRGRAQRHHRELRGASRGAARDRSHPSFGDRHRDRRPPGRELLSRATSPTAAAKAIKRLDGAYALGIVHTDHPGTIIAARKDSPLIIGAGIGENIVASDIPAVLEHTREVVTLDDGQFAVVTADSIDVFDLAMNPVVPETMHVEWDLEAAEKGGYEDFMLKEIFEQPTALRETLRGRMVEGEIQLSELAMTPEQVAAIERVYITACGTSYHAGLVAKYLIEGWARIPVEVAVSSEFRYNDPIVDDQTLVVAITQSGETADTLAGVREARERGAKVVAITNVVGSRVTRESDGVIYTHAGPEIGVAATKTFTAQIAALTVLALKLAQVEGHSGDRAGRPALERDAHDSRRRRDDSRAARRPQGVRRGLCRREQLPVPRQGDGCSRRDGGRAQAQGDKLHPC